MEDKKLMKKFLVIFTAILTVAFMSAIPVMAWGGMDLVVNSNEAFVCNRVSADADTGNNDADGDEGGNGGNGGSIDNDGDDVRRSTTGSGGAGGNGGNGGYIDTGQATADAGVINVVNTNDTTINRCACPEDPCCDAGADVNGAIINGDCECGPAIVYNRNRAMVLNHVEADADTGDNDAEGYDGGNGGHGGNIDNGEECDGCGDVVNSHTGDGGTGGHGGTGGTVYTWDANASASAINVVNRNVTRIRR